MHMRLRSRTSVEHTTNESILNPRAARIPDTRDNTPGSFCTRQLRTCLLFAGFRVKKARQEPSHSSSNYPDRKTCTYFLNGCKLGGGVLYRIFVTASSAVRERGRSVRGKGAGREWVYL